MKMFSQAAEWGNSIGIRIPKAIVRSLSIKKGDELEFVFEDDENQFSVRKINRKPSITLEELVASITPENRHELIEFGGPVGMEDF